MRSPQSPEGNEDEGSVLWPTTSARVPALSLSYSLTDLIRPRLLPTDTRSPILAL